MVRSIMDIDMSDNILSLCYVSKRTDKYTQFCRIADLVDGDFGRDADTVYNGMVP